MFPSELAGNGARLRTEIAKQIHVSGVRSPFDVFDASFHSMDAHLLIRSCKFLQGTLFTAFYLCNLLLKAVMASQKSVDVSLKIHIAFSTLSSCGLF